MKEAIDDLRQRCFKMYTHWTAPDPESLYWRGAMDAYSNTLDLLTKEPKKNDL